MKYLLGIDVGTSGAKTLLFSESGDVLAHAYRAYPMYTPELGFSEQNAEDWWQAVTETIREVCVEPEISKRVVAVSLSTQGGTMVALDEKNRQVRPAMVWNDRRCTLEREAYLNEIGPALTLYEKSGWKLGTGLNLLQIRWMRDNEPENFAKTAMFLSVPDYISLMMTGIAAVDLSNVGINQLADIRKAAYDEELLRFAGITEDKLARIVRSGEVIASLTPKAAEETGLTSDCVLVAGAHDQYAVALGAGAYKAGDILIGSGTSWVCTAISDEADFESGLSQSVAAVPGKWGSLWSLSSGGVCLEWWRRNLAVGTDGKPLSFELIDQEVEKRKAAEEGLYFYPFSGRSSLSKDFEKASLIGMDLKHDRFHVARAIMEGVSFQIIWMMEAFKVEPSKEGLKLAGGASKSRLWSQMVADISNLPVRVPEVADLACVGAAILAGVGSGVYRNAEEGYQRLAVQERVLRPWPEAVSSYSKLFEEYKRCAGLLSEVYGL